MVFELHSDGGCRRCMGIVVNEPIPRMARVPRHAPLSKHEREIRGDHGDLYDSKDRHGGDPK